MFDDILDLLRVLFFLLASMFFLAALPFVICHVADSWGAPAYPHSGFGPDCPECCEPSNARPERP